MKDMKYSLLLLIVIMGCDSTKWLDDANQSPIYTPITISQVGNELTVNCTADKYYWYNWDAHLQRISDGMTSENSLRQIDEWTTESTVTWTQECKVRVACDIDGDIHWSDLLLVKF